MTRADPATPCTQFVKFNGVLRGLDSPVLYLRSQMIRLCCSPEDAAEHAMAVEAATAARKAEKPSFNERQPTAEDEEALRERLKEAYDAAARHANKYTTTLHGGLRPAPP